MQITKLTAVSSSRGLWFTVQDGLELIISSIVIMIWIIGYLLLLL